MCAFCSTEIPVFSLTPPFPIGTLIGVGVGVSVFLLVLLIAVVLILVVVVVRKKTAYKQNRDATMGDNQHYSNTVVANQGLKEKGVPADYKDVVENNGEEEGSIADSFDPFEVVGRKVHTENTKKQAPKESALTASAMNVSAVYPTADKSKRKGAKKEGEDGCNVAQNDVYAMPMKKMGKMTDKGEGVVESGGVEEEEQYDDTVGFKYKPKADSESWQPSEGSFKC